MCHGFAVADQMLLFVREEKLWGQLSSLAAQQCSARFQLIAIKESKDQMITSYGLFLSVCAIATPSMENNVDVVWIPVSIWTSKSFLVRQVTVRLAVFCKKNTLDVLMSAIQWLISTTLIYQAKTAMKMQCFWLLFSLLI